jgi:hypothetical protein
MIVILKTVRSFYAQCISVNKGKKTYQTKTKINRKTMNMMLTCTTYVRCNKMKDDVL